MGQIKAHEFDNFIKKDNLPYNIFLVYGLDSGLISERAKEISKKNGVDLDNDFNLIKLDASEISSDQGRLADEVNSIGLFGGGRLIWIKNAGNDKKFTIAVEKILGDIPDNTSIIIEAGDIKKSSALRKIIEKASKSVAIPCYLDDNRSLQYLIDQELSQENLSIDTDARQSLLGFLGGNRLASRGEIQKLILYCSGQGKISQRDVIDAIGDVSLISVDETINSVLSGNIKGLDINYKRIITSRTPVFLVLRTCLVQLHKIDLMRSEIEINKKRPGQVIAEMGYAIHFKQKPVFEKALNKWTCDMLRKEMDRLSNTILETRRNAQLEISIARQALMRICLLSR